MIKTSKKSVAEKIKEKPELSGMADKLVISELDSYLEKYKISLDAVSTQDIKIIVKDVRTKLRRLSGQFQISSKKSINKNEDNYEKMLRSHTSTSERLDFYPVLSKFILDKNVKSVLDLGCGLNPLALSPFLNGIVYNASDVKEDELEIIKKFFIKNKIKGKVFFCDLRNIKENLPESDLCLIFKVLDIISDKSNRTKLTKELISKIPCKFFIISFSTKKLSGKKMNFPKRAWFENLLRKMGINYEKFSSENEVFYYFKK